MLKPSYAALQQFQSQKKSVHSFQDLKNLLGKLDLYMGVQFESATVWKVDWDLNEGVSGTMDLGIQPRLILGEEVFEVQHPFRFRLEQPKAMGLFVLEYQLVELLKQALDVIDQRG